MKISIILSGDAYHPRTKGVIKRLLQGLDYSTLGNGGTYTGFIVEDSTLEAIKRILGKYTNRDDIHISSYTA
jgi:hypothetical protein